MDSPMSNYGKQSYNEEEKKRQFEEHVRKEESTGKNHPINTSEHFNSNRVTVDATKNINYYNSEKQYDHKRVCDSTTRAYDRMFHVDEGYNPSHKRDDRTYDTNVEQEDVGKPVPTRSSSVYGSKLSKPVELERSRENTRCAVVQKEFFRSGITDELQ